MTEQGLSAHWVTAMTTAASFLKSFNRRCFNPVLLCVLYTLFCLYEPWLLKESLHAESRSVTSSRMPHNFTSWWSVHTTMIAVQFLIFFTRTWIRSPKFLPVKGQTVKSTHFLSAPEIFVFEKMNELCQCFLTSLQQGIILKTCSNLKPQCIMGC